MAISVDAAPTASMYYSLRMPSGGESLSNLFNDASPFKSYVVQATTDV